MIIWFASGNIHKKKELAGILKAEINLSGSLGGKPPELLIPREADIEFDPEETGNSFLENALLKAEKLHRLLEEYRPRLYTSGDAVIADDSGLCVDALDGRPGIHPARYCGSGIAAEEGKALSAAEKNALLLSEIGDNPKRSARFVCAMVLYYSPERFFAVQECLKGELVKKAESAKGVNGFGYDPIFLIPQLGRTVAELSEEEKNRISHRGKAARVISGILALNDSIR
jgi:XTP/dITP diphosphohydrolase